MISGTGDPSPPVLYKIGVGTPVLGCPFVVHLFNGHPKGVSLQ